MVRKEQEKLENILTLTFIALMADLVMEIIFARDIGGLESISENN